MLTLEASQYDTTNTTGGLIETEWRRALQERATSQREGEEQAGLSELQRQLGRYAAIKRLSEVMPLDYLKFLFSGHEQEGSFAQFIFDQVEAKSPNSLSSILEKGTLELTDQGVFNPPAVLQPVSSWMKGAKDLECSFADSRRLDDPRNLALFHFLSQIHETRGKTIQETVSCCRGVLDFDSCYDWFLGGETPDNDLSDNSF